MLICSNLRNLGSGWARPHSLQGDEAKVGEAGLSGCKHREGAVRDLARSQVRKSLVAVWVLVAPYSSEAGWPDLATTIIPRKKQGKP